MSHRTMIVLATFLAGPASAQGPNWNCQAMLFGGLPGRTTAVDTRDSPPALFGKGTVTVQATVPGSRALDRLTNDSAINVDIGAGIRAFHPEVDLLRSRGLAPGKAESRGDPGSDPRIAGRLDDALNERWSLTRFAGFDDTGGGDRTREVFGPVGYAFVQAWSAQVGYRQSDVSYEFDGRDVSVDLGGPVTGMTYRF